MDSIVQPDSAVRGTFLAGALQRLQEDDESVLEDFLSYENSEAAFFDRVEVAHEFIDSVIFKIREGRSRMSKDRLSQFTFVFLHDTLKTYGYNPKFVAIQCKSLITYHQGQRNLDKAIEVGEFLIRNGITDDDSKGFHVRLDYLQHLRKRVVERGLDLRSLKFPVEDEAEEGD